MNILEIKNMKINYSTKNILIGLTGLILIAILLFYISPLAKNSFILWLIIAVLLFMLFGFIKKRANNFVVGLEGENDIDRELKSLGSNYIYISVGLDTGHGNIDKIVIGPTGIWTLEVKSHKGYITYDGQSLLRNNLPLEKNFLGQAYAEAMTLKELIKSKLNLNITVQPVVVFASKYTKVKLGLNKYKGVFVIQKAWLNKLLTETHSQYLTNDIQLKIKDMLSNK